MKIRLLILLFLFFSISPNCNAIHAKLPQNNIEISQVENQLEKNIFELICSFFEEIFKHLLGESNEPLVKSKDVEKLSETMKIYQISEEQNNTDYKNSPSEDSIDFGIGMLNLFASILKRFGI